MPKKTPSYRQRKGYDQAIVTLPDSVTKERRDYWLGTFGSAESREQYHRIVAEWEAANRRLPPPINDPASPSMQISVEEIIHEYLIWSDENHRAVAGNLRAVLRLLRLLYGTTPAEEFGPKKLRLIREAMVRGDPTALPPRKPWTRISVNKQTHRIASIFKWAASQELVPVTVYQALKTIEPLKRGRCDAVEGRPVRPITLEQVDAVRPYLARPLLAMIDLQLLTGARGGELFRLRPCDIDRSGPVWTYTPEDHKTAYRGKSRTIYFGPKAQEILLPLLNRESDAYLFSPAESMKERLAVRRANRKTPLSCGNVSGSNITANPQRRPGGHYTKNSYIRAIGRACERAFPPPDRLAQRKVPAKKGMRWETPAEWEKRLGPKRWQEVQQWRSDHHWHPHQLRHTAATHIRREFGLEAAQIALGHSSALVTEAVYAERDMQKVIEVMQAVG